MKRYLQIKNQLFREFLAETFGIFILIVFTLGAIAQNTFETEKSVLSVEIASGLAVTIAG